ncbi:MAG: hypothetical protein JO297_08005 [Nitrososphaeraceae archaeon]|nr:hypothetical protein [Nitrososphaeraceae archaeon]
MKISQARAMIIYLGVITFRIEHHYEITATSHYYHYRNVFQSRNYGTSFKAK